MTSVRTAFVLVSLITSTAALGQIDTMSVEKSLRMISEFANSMCANPGYQGSSTSLNANASAKAELSKLIRGLLDANVELGADAKKESFQGLLQKDLLEATKLASECRLKIFSELKDRLLFRQPHVESVAHRVSNVSPSFDCPRASNNAERMVCASQDISILDLSMANAYRDVMAEQTSPEVRKQWKSAQNRWLREVRNQCQDILCLTDVYTKRIDHLRQARRQRIVSQ